MQPPRLEATSLFQEQSRKEQIRCEIYNTILEQVHNKIKVTNRMPGNGQQLIYYVPEFIPGVPRFDMKECIIYLVYNLRATGFTVEYPYPKTLIISWREHARNYRLNESPYTRALIEVTEQAIKQKQQALLADQPADGKPKKSSIRKTSEYKTSNLLPSASSNNASEEKEIKSVHFI